MFGLNLDKITEFSNFLGFCETSKFDQKFIWNTELKNGRFWFRGFHGSLIYWNSEKKQWIFENSEGNNYATINEKEYPIGRKNWLFKENPCDGENETTKM